jgi:hypothetical protein
MAAHPPRDRGRQDVFIRSMKERVAYLKLRTDTCGVDRPPQESQRPAGALGMACPPVWMSSACPTAFWTRVR